MRSAITITLLAILSISSTFAQTDSSIVFTSPDPLVEKSGPTSYNDAWGVDILLSNNGFGFAGFYRRTFSRELSGSFTFGISEAKDENEVEYTTWYGQTFVPGKINRFLFAPMLFGVEYRLFADDIMDSFRPYVNGGVGPTIIWSAPFSREFFNSLSYARTHYTVGGYVGFGAFFGSDMGSLAGVNIRYYFIPVKGGIESLIDPAGKISKKSDFGGFFITINLGSAF